MIKKLMHCFLMQSSPLNYPVYPIPFICNPAFDLFLTFVVEIEPKEFNLNHMIFHLSTVQPNSKFCGFFSVLLTRIDGRDQDHS